VLGSLEQVEFDEARHLGQLRIAAEPQAEVYGGKLIYRIESGEEPTTDEVLARLKKWRL